jgi:hypothetical protein
MHRSTLFRCLYASLSKPGGRQAKSASPQTMADLVGRLRDDRTDASAPKVGADGT